jgi:hypothetical protein
MPKSWPKFTSDSPPLQVVRNLVWLAKVLVPLPVEEAVPGSQRTSFRWLINKLLREAKIELMESNGKVTVKVRENAPQ